MDECAIELTTWISKRLHLTPTLTFFRKSPEGQVEPNYIHHDAPMGDWTGILYLNETPAHWDGTLFWTHVDGAERSTSEDDKSSDWDKPEKWKLSHAMQAKFNRLLLFEAPLFHSRSIKANYGHADDARLIQVVFGTGRLPA